MKEETNNTSTIKGRKIVLSICFILELILSIFSIYHILLLNNIENEIRYFVVGIFILLDLIFFFKWLGIIQRKRKKVKKHIGFIIVLLLLSIVHFAIGYYIGKVYGFLGNMTKEKLTYTSYLLTLKDNKASTTKDLDEKKVGIIQDSSSIEGYQLAMELIEEEGMDAIILEKYEDYLPMIEDLYQGSIEAIFVGSNYQDLVKENEAYQNIKNDTKILKQLNKDIKKTLNTSGKAAITEPFTVLLTGVDSEKDGLDQNQVANGDSLMLVTFNPKTLNATILSIPRDSYVPISCFTGKIENKITHAAAYGEQCLMDTIVDLVGIPIDYYVKINFKGAVGLVDALGGIDVEVPARLCTDDSSRAGEVCIDEGYQHLNGEQALVLARNRKQLAAGDLDRGLNQQVVVEGMLNKVKTINSVDKLMDILNTVSRNMDTNLTNDQILSFYNIIKDIMFNGLNKENGQLVNLQQLYLQGTGQMIYDERAKMVLWDYVLNDASVDDVIEAMKINLELIDHEEDKSFSFSINDPYEKTIIGKGPYKTQNSYTLLPDFTGDTEAQSRAWASKHGISIKFQEVETSQHPEGRVFAQDFPANKRTDKISGSVTLSIAKAPSKKKPTTPSNDDKDQDKDEEEEDIIDCSKDKYKNHPICKKEESSNSGNTPDE